jgi:hypothetical protein
VLLGAAALYPAARSLGWRLAGLGAALTLSSVIFSIATAVAGFALTSHASPAAAPGIPWAVKALGLAALMVFFAGLAVLALGIARQSYGAARLSATLAIAAAVTGIRGLSFYSLLLGATLLIISPDPGGATPLNYCREECSPRAA